MCLFFVRFNNLEDIGFLDREMGEFAFLLLQARLIELMTSADRFERIGPFYCVVAHEKEPSDSPETIQKKLNLWYKELERPFHLEGKKWEAHISLAALFIPEHATQTFSILHYAEYALNLSYQHRIAYLFSPSHYRESQNQAQVIFALDQAIFNDELTIHFQPKIHFETKKKAGYELLIRWENTHLGVIEPSVFIPIAQQRGHIPRINHKLLTSACTLIARCLAKGLDIEPLSINIFPSDLCKPKFIEFLDYCLTSYNIPPHLLEIELLEDGIYQNESLLETFLKKIKERGLAISLDDFGTGYANLAYIQSLPLDTLKIDRRFVGPIQHNFKTRALLRSIIDIGKQNHLKVLAEGIETQEQEDILREMGCDMGQGYLYGKSQPLAMFHVEH